MSPLYFEKGQMNPFTPEEVLKIRKDFPILHREIRGKPLIYLDNAATTQKPIQVIEMQAKVYKELNANVHRGVHFLSQESTDAYEKSRKKIARHLGIKDDGEIIFTRGTTEAINLVAASMGKGFLKEGDSICVTRMEHHSNFVPWQVLAKDLQSKFVIVELDSDYQIDLKDLDKKIKENSVRLLAFTAMSNVLGTINPVQEIAAIAKKHDCIVLVDAAQAMVHLPLRLSDWEDVDFLAFSAHKMCGPTGIGVLWGRRELLEKLSPYQYGGDMILQVKDEITTWNELPWKFEAGTPNYGDSIAFGIALDYLESLGMGRIYSYENQLVGYARKILENMKGVDVLATKRDGTHSGVISFVCEGIHPHDIATYLDAEGVAIRAGHHCAQPLMTKLKLPATNRISFSFYNTKEEVDQMAKILSNALDFFGRG